MQYGYKKAVSLDYDTAVERTREELKAEGFGVLTEIDVKATLKEKLDVDFERYVILGTCNPPFAYEALKTERDIGLLLPCNVLVYEQEGQTYVSAILPTVAMQVTDNDSLGPVATQVEEKLVSAVDNVAAYS